MHKHIEVITHFDTKGKVTPYRLKYEDAKEQSHVIHIDKIIKCDDTRHNGNPMREYLCRINNKGTQKQIKLYYEIIKCLWYIDKQ